MTQAAVPDLHLIGDAQAARAADGPIDALQVTVGQRHPSGVAVERLADEGSGRASGRDELEWSQRWWFQQDFERRDVPFIFVTADDPDLDFDPPPDADFDADVGVWRSECAVSRRIVAAHDLDETARPLDWSEDVDLRWLVLRMITEYAQHCGHLDLLREGIDGRTGS